jgi:hypothetical protein
MAKEINDGPVLRDVPLVTFGALGRALDVGPGATKAAAERLGIESTRMPNGREFLTFEQAQAVARDMCRSAS